MIALPRSPGLIKKLAIGLALVSMSLVIGLAVAVAGGRAGQGAEAGAVREYDLDIVPADIDYGTGVWHAWTYGGTVPGTTIRANAGDTLRIRVTNKHDKAHSFHAHLDGFTLENDGSQMNAVMNVGMGSLIAPGNSYVYTFKPMRPGLYYYHSHFSDESVTPTQEVTQGMYGAILISDPKEPPMREEVLFMGEIGHLREGKTPPYIMNGLGFTGGEAGVGHLNHDQMAEQYDKTLPTFRLKVGETIKLHVINIGSLEHSLYIHTADIVSLGVLNGRMWPGRVLPLVPGAADTLQVTFNDPGPWLFHCHVDPHTDAGMLGVFE
ncbi:MAG: multicopper oxidase domain-containing protein, partial [Chloroflexi bacterium]|nr:multicopper oxidase domain-containing protein [Chloroflexota bacterium]